MILCKIIFCVYDFTAAPNINQEIKNEFRLQISKGLDSHDLFVTDLANKNYKKLLPFQLRYKPMVTFS